MRFSLLHHNEEDLCLSGDEENTVMALNHVSSLHDTGGFLRLALPL